MAPFKDYLKQDIDNVFFNTDEFAEPHTINGTTVNIVIDNDHLMKRSKQEFDGISVGEILFYVGKAALDPILKGRPEEGAPLVFDKRPMIVFNSREDNGVYEIILTQNRGM